MLAGLGDQVILRTVTVTQELLDAGSCSATPSRQAAAPPAVGGPLQVYGGSGARRSQDVHPDPETLPSLSPPNATVLERTGSAQPTRTRSGPLRGQGPGFAGGAFVSLNRKTAAAAGPGMSLGTLHEPVPSRPGAAFQAGPDGTTRALPGAAREVRGGRPPAPYGTAVVRARRTGTDGRGSSPGW